MTVAGLRSRRLGLPWLLAGVAAVLAATTLGVLIGPVTIRAGAVIREVLDLVPFIQVDSNLSNLQSAIISEIRFPRVVLGLLVGAMLAVAGASYQGVFRNPLADPYLLGVAAGAGLGATIAIVAGAGAGTGFVDPVPLAAFAGALVAVAVTYLVGAVGGTTHTATTLILAGVAVAAFATAVQTYVQQRESDRIRQVYAWILGSLSTAGWVEVATLLPYVIVTAAVLLLHGRTLDVLAVGDDEASALGLHASRRRLVIVVAASLGTAAAVSVSGLIGFVGIIIPHTVRLIMGSSYRVILPLSLLFGAAFLVLADILTRMVIAPAEIPIGVVTAFFGAPFFIVVLRTSRRLL